MKRIVVAQKLNNETTDLIRKKIGGELQVGFLYGLDDKSRAKMLSRGEILLAMNMRRDIHEDEFRLLKEFQLIQITLAGADIIPYDKLSRQTLVCSNSGGYSEPIAEHAIGMMLALARNFLPLHRDLGRGIFDQKTVHKMLGGATLGVIGFGGIGRRTAEIARAFGMRINAVNRSGSTDEKVDFIGTLSDLDLVLKKSDFVLLAIALNKMTRGVIDSSKLELMKEDAILVNVARGDLVDEEGLYNHLKAHPRFKAGIEAWWIEPFNSPKFEVHYPFFELDNFLGSPHNSYLTEGIHFKALDAALENVLRFVRGATPWNIQNPDDYV